MACDTDILDNGSENMEKVDITEVVESSFNVPLLNLLIKQLIGEPFLFFRISYGGELTLHMGEAKRYAHPKMKHLTKGSYILGARASSWVVRSAPTSTLLTSSEGVAYHRRNNVVDPDHRIALRSIETIKTIEAGSLVVAAECVGYSPGLLLRLKFSDGSEVMILPLSDSSEQSGGDEPANPAEQIEVSDVELPDWELFTPHNRVLKVGPEHRWSYTDSEAKPI